MLEEWGRHWRLGSGDLSGDLADGKWRRHWRVSGWGVDPQLRSLHCYLHSPVVKSPVLFPIPGDLIPMGVKFIPKGFDSQQT